MNPEEIKLSDWKRIFLGDTPPEFFLEVVLRTVFVFLLLIIAMRLLGRRMAARTSRIELVALFSLAAAIGVPLQAPDRGLLPAIVIAIVVILVGRLVAIFAFKDPKFEQTVVDDFTILVKDGVVQMGEMKKARITLERLFALLRGESIRHLGEVERLYFEANGSLTVVKPDTPNAGLAVIPVIDKEFLDQQPQATANVCRTCGSNEETAKNKDGKCSNCGDEEWVSAIR